MIVTLNMAWINGFSNGIYYNKTQTHLTHSLVYEHFFFLLPLQNFRLISSSHHVLEQHQHYLIPIQDQCLVYPLQILSNSPAITSLKPYIQAMPSLTWSTFQYLSKRFIDNITNLTSISWFFLEKKIMLLITNFFLSPKQKYWEYPSVLQLGTWKDGWMMLV